MDRKGGKGGTTASPSVSHSLCFSGDSATCDSSVKVCTQRHKPQTQALIQPHVLCMYTEPIVCEA